MEEAVSLSRLGDQTDASGATTNTKKSSASIITALETRQVRKAFKEPVRFFQRFAAAFLAISDRFLALRELARAAPPSALACGSLPSFPNVSSSSPTAILAALVACR